MPMNSALGSFPECAAGPKSLPWTMAILDRLALWRKTFRPDLADLSLMAGVIAVSALAAMPTILSNALKVALTHGS